MLSKTAPLLLLLLLLLLVRHKAAAATENQHGHLHVKFLQYAVPDSRLANGRYCDSFKILGLEKRVSACDPQINLCVGRGDPKSCTVGKISLPWVKNSDVVNFGSHIGDKPNPVALPFVSLPATLSLGATINEHDRVGSPDLIESITGSVAASREKKTVRLSGRTHLKIQVWFTCNSNYYGYLCRMYNYCHTKPCAHGRCVNGASGFNCHCPSEWTGARCEKAAAAANPCAGRKATKTHQCRVRYRFGRPNIFAIEHATNPTVQGGRCVMQRTRRVIKGAEAKRFCRG